MSILSFKERGPWGKSSWRGNTSGHVIKNLLGMFQPTLFVDPAEGSGTSRDVAKDMGIQYEGFDLHSGFNLLNDRLIERLPRPADLVFFHPPYHSMVLYSGEQWGKPNPDDLSRCKDVDEFIEKLQLAVMNIYDATRGGGHYSVLIGDMRKEGQYHSFQADVIKYGLGKLKSVMIKAQHNCVSDRKEYNGSFVPIQHEYLLIFQKDTVIKSFIDYALGVSDRLKSASNASWRNLVRWAMMNLGSQDTSLAELYSEMERCAGAKITGNGDWKAKVRQILQLHPEFINVDRGIWKMAA